jgi:Zn-dependent peptidase ImmA (M78 family)
MVDSHMHDPGHRAAAAPAFVPSVARWDLAQKTADNLTAPYRTPPIPVLEIAERNGVDVVFADFGTHTDAVAGFCDFKTKRLYVNKDDRTERQFFTIAHELGHWMLHRDIFLAHPDRYPVLPRFQNVDAHSPMEKEANCFAANLLVPARLLRPVMSAPVSSLASIFRVSRTMMEFRVNNVRG